MNTKAWSRVAAALLAPALFAGGLIISAGPAQAVYAPVKAFDNCTKMQKVYAYRGGVKKPGAVDHRSSGHAQYTPYVGLKRYRLNSSLDRDKDGVACEA
jgi:hypothetical protein